MPKTLSCSWQILEYGKQYSNENVWETELFYLIYADVNNLRSIFFFNISEHMHE